jgi:two-component system, NarL family, nitrate/nitrite response regulator NarL
MDRACIRTTVLVADDHPIYRAGVVGAIAQRSDLELVAVCAGGREALEQLAVRPPDVALLDVRMPDPDGMAVLEELVRSGSRTRVVFLSAHEDGDIVHAALSAGASGYLSKACDRSDICDAIVAAAGGRRVIRLPTPLTFTDFGTGRPEMVLTAREAQTMRLTADGLSAPEIASALGIGTTTVRTHLERVYRKLGVTDRAAMVAAAMRLGLLT